VDPGKRRLDGMVTSVYQLLIYRVTNLADDGSSTSLEEAQKDAVFVKASGLEEDRAAARAIQGSLSSNANQHLTFGLFEKATVHFHQNMAEYLARLQ
jgi:hypothetical protein